VGLAAEAQANTWLSIKPVCDGAPATTFAVEVELGHDVPVGRFSAVIACPGSVGAVDPHWTVYGSTVPTGEPPAAAVPVPVGLKPPVDWATTAPAAPRVSSARQGVNRFIASLLQDRRSASPSAHPRDGPTAYAKLLCCRTAESASQQQVPQKK
jgi:hypothetical protein